VCCSGYVRRAGRRGYAYEALRAPVRTKNSETRRLLAGSFMYGWSTEGALASPSWEQGAWLDLECAAVWCLYADSMIAILLNGSWIVGRFWTGASEIHTLSLRPIPSFFKTHRAARCRLD
jgi:hypothetical protein